VCSLGKSFCWETYFLYGISLLHREFCANLCILISSTGQTLSSQSIFSSCLRSLSLARAACEHLRRGTASRWEPDDLVARRSAPSLLFPRSFFCRGLPVGGAGMATLLRLAACTSPVMTQRPTYLSCLRPDGAQPPCGGQRLGCFPQATTACLSSSLLTTAFPSSPSPRSR
jgi:hypothetical protein